MVAPNHADTFDRLRSLLHFHEGRTNAITIEDMARVLEVSRREIETTIEHNLAEFPWPLVADGVGYYQPTEADELNRYVHQLHTRHQRLKVRENTVISKALASGWTIEAGEFKRPFKTKQGELFTCI